ncbi:MAG: aldose 1-epimerase family protein [Chloroflexota bacterium]|nr:aldose 1-epimerase family protein [Chloroflexota bacterium]
MNYDGLSRQELLKHVGHMDQLAGVKLLEAADGLARDSRLLQVWTGSGLTFDLLADRALDISACRYKGIPLAWVSSVGEVHPAYYDSRGLGWLRSFPGGLLATCGLDHWGPPTSDLGEEFGLHGRVSNLPARYVSYRAGWMGEQYELEITGEVRQAAVFGENLVLRRRISTRLGSNMIQIDDVVTNEGFESQPHMILYHFNLGFPLLSPDTHLHVDSQETIPRDAEAESDLENWMNFQPPTAGYQEQVFRHKPLADEDGRVAVEVSNTNLGLGLRLTYANANLPYLVQWKMMGEGMYVLGVEPVNCGVLEGRGTARERGSLPHLEPGESRQYALTVEVIEDR